jgi:hypothetical protein
MIHDDVVPVLSAEAAWELGEVLEFLCGWIDHDRRSRNALDASMFRFSGGGYTLDELRGILARHAVTLGADPYLEQR